MTVSRRRHRTMHRPPQIRRMCVTELSCRTSDWRKEKKRERNQIQERIVHILCDTRAALRLSSCRAVGWRPRLDPGAVRGNKMTMERRARQGHARKTRCVAVGSASCRRYKVPGYLIRTVLAAVRRPPVAFPRRRGATLHTVPLPVSHDPGLTRVGGARVAVLFAFVQVATPFPDFRPLPGCLSPSQTPTHPPLLLHFAILWQRIAFPPSLHHSSHSAIR